MTIGVPSTSYLKEQAERLLPEGYVAVLPLLAGTAAALGTAAEAIETWADAATISSSTGSWLDLLARGFGLYRKPDELDDSLRQRIASIPKALTPAAIEAAVNAILDPDICTVVEHWKARVYCDDGSTEYVTDLFCDEDTVLGVRNGVTVVCPEGLTDAQELAVCAAVNAIRAAGVRAWVVFDDDLDAIIYGLDTDEP